MTRPWIDKQKQEQRQDGRIRNYLANKSKDFSLVLESDRRQTFHVYFVLFIISRRRFWAVSTTKGPVNYKRTAAENGIPVAFVTTRSLIIQSQGRNH